MVTTIRRQQVCRVCRGLETPGAIPFFMGSAAKPLHTLHTPVRTRQSGRPRTDADHVSTTFARPHATRGGAS